MFKQNGTNLFLWDATHVPTLYVTLSLLLSLRYFYFSCNMMSLVSLVSQSWPKGCFFCLSTGWPRFTCTAVSAYVTPQTSGYSTLHLRSSVDMWSQHASIDSDWVVIIFLPITQFDAFTAGVIVQDQSLQMCSISLPSCNWQTSNHIWHTLSFADLIFCRD